MSVVDRGGTNRCVTSRYRGLMGLSSSRPGRGSPERAGPERASPFPARADPSRLAAENWDLVVVGGGITGCGVALEAASRGLRTALVEGADLSSGTSSRSSKLVHGGLRYLSNHELRLVAGALTERQRLLTNAPHLVRPLPFLVPLFGRDGVVSEGVAKAYSTALWLYDLCGGLRIGHRHRRVGRAEVLAHQPTLRTDRLVAGFLYWDAQADDARLTLAVARTAAAHGAVILTRSPVVELLAVPGGNVGGVVLADGTEVHARVVVDAGGVWAGAVADLPGPGDRSAPRVRPAKGVHLTVSADRLPCDWAAVLPVPGDRRTIFVAPWDAAGADGPAGPGRFTYIGTTDTDYDGDLSEPVCTAADRDVLLDAVNASTGAGLRPGDVTATWAGLRPLVADGTSARTVDLSRRHRVEASAAGLVTVTGGKLTTYRRMAADAVDTAVSLSGLGGRHRSPTRRLELIGADGWQEVGSDGPLLSDPAIRLHLQGRYGAEAAVLDGLCRSEPSLTEPLVAGLPYRRVEAIWAVRAEMATTLDDVLARRTRAALLDRDATAAAAAGVARLLAGELGWDTGREQAEVDAYLSGVERERAALRSPAGMPAVTP